MTLGEDFRHGGLVEKHGNKGQPGYHLLHPGRVKGQTHNGKTGDPRTGTMGDQKAVNQRKRVYGAAIQNAMKKPAGPQRDKALNHILNRVMNDSVLGTKDYDAVLDELERAHGGRSGASMPDLPPAARGGIKRMGGNSNQPKPPAKKAPAKRAAKAPAKKAPGPITRLADQNRADKIKGYKDALRGAASQRDIDAIEARIERDRDLKEQDKQDLAGDVNQARDGLRPAKKAPAKAPSRWIGSRKRDEWIQALDAAESKTELERLGRLISADRGMNAQDLEALALAYNRAQNRLDARRPKTAHPGLVRAYKGQIKDAQGPTRLNELYEGIRDDWRQGRLNQTEFRELENVVGERLVSPTMQADKNQNVMAGVDEWGNTIFRRMGADIRSRLKGRLRPSKNPQTADITEVRREAERLKREGKMRTSDKVGVNEAVVEARRRRARDARLGQAQRGAPAAQALNPARPDAPNILGIDVDDNFPAGRDGQAAMEAMLDKMQDGPGRRMIDPARGDVLYVAGEGRAARVFRQLAQQRGLDVRSVGIGRRGATHAVNQNVIRRMEAKARLKGGRRQVLALRPVGGTVVGQDNLAEQWALRSSRKDEGALVIGPKFRARMNRDGEEIDPNAFGLAASDIKARIPSAQHPDRQRERLRQAEQAQKAHFNKAGAGISDAPEAGLYDFIQANPQRFEVVPNGQRGVSPNYWVTDNGKRPPERWMFKKSTFPQDVVNEDITAQILARAGFAMPPTKRGDGDSQWMAQRHYEEGVGGQIINNREVNRPDAAARLAAGPDPDATARLIMFDYLINNTPDRHGNNILLLEDGAGWRLGIIDQGLAFGQFGGHSATSTSFVQHFRNYRAHSWGIAGLAKRIAGSDRALEETLRRQMDGFDKVDVAALRQYANDKAPSPEEARYIDGWITEFERRRAWMRANLVDVVNEINRRA